MDASTTLQQKYATYDAKIAYDRGDGLTFYIAEILRDEISFAKSREKSPENLVETVIESGQAKVLVLLVGYSIEPLLLSLYHHNPLEVVLILNRKYRDEKGDEAPGIAYADKQVVSWLQEVIQKFQLRTVISTPIKALANDTPSDVFHFLQNKIDLKTSDPQQVVIDITGGKKSMVSGAFLFAAYTGSKISYVDFDDYDINKSRPMPGTCQVGLLPNPYATFALRDWEQAASLYEQYDYQGAARELEVVKQGMAKELFTQDQKSSLCCMKSIIEQVYYPWSNSDYLSANQAELKIKANHSLATHYPSYQPLVAVSKLGENWFLTNKDILENLVAVDQIVYPTPSLVQTYAEDEIKKIRRLIDVKHDYRSGLLRAAGLHEVLLKARLAILFVQGGLSFFRDSDGKPPVPEGDSASIKAIYDGLDFQKVLNILKCAKPQKSGGILISRKPSGPFWQDKVNWVKIMVDTNIYRNKAIHNILPISQSIAQSALGSVKENLAEYLSGWAKLIDKNPKQEFPDALKIPPDWQELCRWFKIDFLPVKSPSTKTSKE